MKVLSDNLIAAMYIHGHKSNRLGYDGTVTLAGIATAFVTDWQVVDCGLILW